jgi:hypothetical protein
MLTRDGLEIPLRPKADYYDTYASRVAEVSAADVQAASTRWLRTEGLTVAIAGDAAAIREDMESLKMGAVHVDENG